MPVPPLHVRVFLSSPGDVADERTLARSVLKDELPVDPFLRGRVSFETVSWDDPAARTPMLANLAPQEAVDRHLAKPSQCDVVVVILWSRMGTPLSEKYRKPDGAPYLSGTEWEYEDAINAQPQPDILVYRRTETPKIDLTDPKLDEKREQYALVEHFFERFRNPDASTRGGVTTYVTSAEFKDRLASDLRALLERKLEALPASSSPQPVDPPALWSDPPYPGLRAFRPDEASIFFGRELELDQLIQRLRDPGQRFVAVVGASGTGKSSLIRAGLLPRLRGNAIAGSKDWCIVDFTPAALGDNLILSIAAPLNDLLPVRLRARPIELARHLTAKPEHIHELARDALAEGPDWAELVLFADQLEELFSAAAEPYRPGFINLLASAAATERVRVIATLRADFLPQAMGEARLAELLRTETFLLAPAGPAGLLDMIQRPAERAGVELEKGLAEAIRDEVGPDPGALPLMAFALAELYRRSQPARRLTCRAYDQMGRLKGAIAARSHEVMAKLPAEARAALPQLFQGLVHVDATGTATRRRAHRAEVASDEVTTQLLDSLTESEARLLHANERHGEPTVEVAHEALFEGWPELRHWIEENEALLIFRSEIEARMALWERASDDRDDLLLKSNRLSEALSIVNTQPTILSPSMITFINASKAREQILVQQNELERRRECLRIIERSKRESIVGNNSAGVLLALEALHYLVKPDTRLLAEIEACLYKSLWDRLNALVIEDPTDPPVAAQVSPAVARRLLTISRGGTARLWDTATGHLCATCEGQPGPIATAGFSPDGSRIVMASQDGTAHLWNVTDGTLRATLEGHSGPVVAATFSPNSKRLVTASHDGSARLWDANSGNRLAVLHVGDAVIAAEFTPDGSRVMTISRGGTTQIWDAANGTLRATLGGQLAPVVTARWGAMSEYIVSVSRDGTVRRWNSAAGAPPTVFSGLAGPVRAAEISPDGKRIVAISEDGTIRLWDLVVRAPVAILEGHAGPALTAGFSPDGSRIVTASQDGTACLWNAIDGTLQATLEGHMGPIVAASFSPDSRSVVTAAHDGTVRLWGTAATALCIPLQGHTGSVTTAVCSPDGRCIATASTDGTVRLWEAATGATLATLSHTGPVIAASFSADSKRIMSATQDGNVRIWKLARCASQADLPGRSGSVSAVAFSADCRRAIIGFSDGDVVLFSDDHSVIQNDAAPITAAAFNSSGRRIITGRSDGTIQLWDFAKHSLLAKVDGHEGKIVAVAFSADGRRALSASRDGTARLWRVSSRITSAATLSGHAGPLTSAAFSGDGKQIVTASEDGTARLWAAARGTPICTLEGHRRSTTVAAFSADASRVITGSRDGTAQLWDSATGTSLLILPGHARPLTAASFSPDGEYVITACDDTTARIWRVFPRRQALFEEARRAVPRELSADERDRFNLRPASVPSPSRGSPPSNAAVHVVQAAS